MSKYQKKPVIIEAIQWSESGFKGQARWLTDALDSGIIKINQDATCTIKTLEGDYTASSGDFIIQGIQGELYPCKPDIFEATYELVKE